MQVKITANANALVLGTDTLIAANNELYTRLETCHAEVDPSTGKIVRVYIDRPGNNHYAVAIGTTAGTVHRVQVGEITTSGGFCTYLDSL